MILPEQQNLQIHFTQVNKMKTEQFCEWLQAYVDLSETPPNNKQWDKIKEKLSTVEIPGKEKKIEDRTFEDLEKKAIHFLISFGNNASNIIEKCKEKKNDFGFNGDLFKKVEEKISKFKEIIDVESFRSNKLNQDLPSEELEKKAKELIDLFGDRVLEVFMVSFKENLENNKLIKKIEELLYSKKK